MITTKEKKAVQVAYALKLREIQPAPSVAVAKQIVQRKGTVV